MKIKSHSKIRNFIIHQKKYFTKKDIPEFLSVNNKKGHFCFVST